MKKLLLFLLFTLSVSPLFSQDNYVYIDSGGPYNFYINPNINRTDMGYYQCWIKFIPFKDIAGVIRKKQKLNSKSNYSKFSHSLVLYLYDISNNKYKILEYIDYDKSSNIIYDWKDNEYLLEWSYVVPGTIAEAILNSAKILVNKQ